MCSKVRKHQHGNVSEISFATWHQSGNERVGMSNQTNSCHTRWRCRCSWRNEWACQTHRSSQMFSNQGRSSPAAITLPGCNFPSALTEIQHLRSKVGKTTSWKERNQAGTGPGPASAEGWVEGFFWRTCERTCSAAGSSSAAPPDLRTGVKQAGGFTTAAMAAFPGKPAAPVYRTNVEDPMLRPAESHWKGWSLQAQVLPRTHT